MLNQIVPAGNSCLAVGVFGEHAEILFAGLFVDTIVVFVPAAQILKVGMFVACDFGAHTDDDGFAHVGADIRDTHHIGEQVFKIGIKENIALALAHPGQVILLQLGDHVCRELSEGLDAVGRVDVAFCESLFWQFANFYDDILPDFNLPEQNR